MDWFLSDIGLRHEKVKKRMDLPQNVRLYVNNYL